MSAFDIVACELCGEDAWLTGALGHMQEFGHWPQVGGEPVLPKRPIRRMWWSK